MSSRGRRVGGYAGGDPDGGEHVGAPFARRIAQLGPGSANGCRRWGPKRLPEAQMAGRERTGSRATFGSTGMRWLAGACQLPSARMLTSCSANRRAAGLVSPTEGSIR